MNQNEDIRDAIKGVKQTFIQSQGALFTICNRLLMNGFYLFVIDNKPLDGFFVHFFILRGIFALSYASIILFVARLGRGGNFHHLK